MFLVIIIVKFVKIREILLVLIVINFCFFFVKGLYGGVGVSQEKCVFFFYLDSFFKYWLSVKIKLKVTKELLIFVNFHV